MALNNPINRSEHLLYPPFLAMVKRGLEKAHAAGLMAYIFEGYRSLNRQTELYNQGRTTPGAVITWAKPGQSLHHYGVAVDIVFDGNLLDAGIQWSWEGKYADGNGDKYDDIAKIFKAEGLEWLGDKNIERAHFQKSFGYTVSQMQQIVEMKGLLELWRLFDSKSGVK
jgi:peptidoglycan L-alanyl-D-glutamate endopeptidase CwlK